MTKEEQLKQEAKEYAKPWKNSLAYVSIKDAYLAGVEPREKQIEIDAIHIRALQKQNGELTDKVKELEEELIEADNATDVFNAQEKRIAELEAQIEKMKCCETCRYYHYHEIGTGNKDCILWYRDKVFCENKNMWELGR